MDGLFASGRFIDLVIALTIIEGVALTLHHRWTGRGLALKDFGLNLASGLWLMLALRSALVSAGWPWIAMCLLAAGAAHGADIWLRWRAKPQSVKPS